MQISRLSALSDEDIREEMQRFVDQVDEAGVSPDEEKQLRAALRRMDERRSNVERCGMISSAIEGELVSEGKERVFLNNCLFAHPEWEGLPLRSSRKAEMRVEADFLYAEAA